ncbi:MAG TPA: hypothetical protein VFN67_35855 [Polyangiales bacterium]|nr:hypothetical protein [Polyangiales bacterium]
MIRVPTIAAVSFVLLLSCAALICSAPPQVDDSGRAILAWAQTNQRAIGTQVWLVAVAWLPGGVLFTLVHRRMRGAPATAFLLGTALSLCLIFISGMFRLGLMRHANALTASEARLVADIESQWGPLATIGNVLQAGALAIAIQRGQFAPWLFPISLMFAVEQGLETVTILMSGSIWGPGGLLNLAGAALYLLWALAIGIALPMSADADADVHPDSRR